MGELHLEVIRDRIRGEHAIDVDLGKLQVSYHETVTSSSIDTLEVSKTIGNFNFIFHKN